jgi:hypothetical protein
MEKLMNVCDVCHVAKAVWVAILNRVETTDSKLYFCNHHYVKHAEKLKEQGFIIIKC